MKKTINVNLAGIIFYIDEDTYQHFSDYLNAVRKQFSNAEERDEIVADIEARIAELLQEKLSDAKQVVTRQDVDAIISIMGGPEDYKVDEDEDTSGSTKSSSTYSRTEYAGPKRLYRNPDDKILGGVSGGLGAYFGMDPLWIRLIWVALFFGAGTGFLLYIILWIVMPEAKTTAQKLQMRGEPINIDNIERSVKEEMKDVKERISNFSKSENFARTGGRVRNGIEDIVAAALSILRMIFTFLFKFIGGVLMFAGVIVLIVLISIFMGNDYNINGANLDYANLSAYLSALMSSTAQTSFLIVGIIMLALAPVIGLILLGMRILFNYRAKQKWVGAGLVVISVLGTIFIFSAMINLAVAFTEEATYSETIELGTDHQNYTLRLGELLDDQRPYELDWTITDKAQLISFVHLDVRMSENEKPYMEITSESHGRSRLEARQRAKNMNYYTEVQDSIISVADYFTIPSDEKFRGQNMQLVLYLPIGSSVYLDESVIDILDDVKNVTNTWDGDMVAHTWIMTQNGLACMDCNGKADSWKSKEDWETYEDQFENEANEFDEEAHLKEAERKLKEAEKLVEELKKKEKNK
jgi:phage shock protein PspC (stress-responsive transcriptional regulator)